MTHDILVPMTTIGELQPLFLIHPIGGNIICYSDLVHQLHINRPIYGLQASGLVNATQQLNSVEDMATAYINKILTVQPEGPYHLCGWSFGGVIAFEIAKQLLEKHNEVAPIIMIDSYAPAIIQQSSSLKDVKSERLLLLFTKDLAETLQKPLLITEADLASLDHDKQLELVLDALHNAHLIGSEEERGHFKVLYNEFTVNTQALFDYQPHKQNVEIHLISAKDKSAFYKAIEIDETLLNKDNSQGWQTLCDKLTIESVPGDHYSILHEQYVTVLANLIRKDLS